jgi:hypothetical protein
LDLQGDTGTEPVIEEDERTKPIGSDENESDEEEDDEPQPAKFFKNLPPAEVYDTCLAKSAAQNAMFQIISMMIAHVGFDGGSLVCALPFIALAGKKNHQKPITCAHTYIEISSQQHHIRERCIV